MWNIIFYIDRRGKCPALEFIDDLPVMEQAKVRNALRLLREFGTNLGMPHAKPIQAKLWELRPGGIRLSILPILTANSLFCTETGSKA
jgi:phage-related protein